MQLTLALTGARRRPGPANDLLAHYVKQANRYEPFQVTYPATESALLAARDQARGRTAAALLLADATGDTLTSTQLAARCGQWRDAGRQHLIVAIGPADGWSPAALTAADATVSFGRITLPHELAAVVAAEQLYRALTILAGHPYHLGH